jgi:hypothetical protein
MSALRVGIGERNITPPIGVDLSGFAHREGPSEAIHDDLWCRAVVLDDGATRLGIVALDLLELDFELDAAVRRAVSEATAIDPDHLLLNCSHTHAGPATGAPEGTGYRNQGYISRLPAEVAAAVSRAEKALSAARLSYGESELQIGIDRRERQPDGSIDFGRNPDGPADRKMRVVRIDTDEAAGAAVIFNYACHGTTLKEENREISAEWMGAAISHLRRIAGDALTPVFLQGCCGQINPDVSAATFEEVDRIGARAAEAVAAAMQAAQPVEAVALRAQLQRVGLPLQDAPAVDCAEASLRQAERTVEQLRRHGAAPYVVRAFESLVTHSQRMLARSKRQAAAETVPFAIQVIGLGEMAIVGLSGEVFFEFAEEIQSRSPFRHTLVLGYSNGCTCYVPTEEAFGEGGYEVDDSFAWYGLPPLRPEAGGVMVEATMRMLEDPHSQGGHA